MPIQLKFFQCNSDYSQEEADQNNEGQPSENNIQYHWEDELKITGDVFKISEPIEDEYQLQGVKEEKEFSYTVPNMLKFKFLSEDHSVTEIAVSKSVLLNYEQKNQEDNKLFCFYLSDHTLITNPITGVYIDIDDFPEELK